MRVVQLVAHSFRSVTVGCSNPARFTSRLFFWQGGLMHMPVNTAVRAVVRSSGEAAPLEVLCLRVGAVTRHRCERRLDMYLEGTKLGVENVSHSLGCFVFSWASLLCVLQYL